MEKDKNVDKLPHARRSEVICVKILSKIKNCKEENSGIVFPNDKTSSIRDMIHQIKKINKNDSTKYIFKFLSHKFDNVKKIKKFDIQHYVNN